MKVFEIINRIKGLKKVLGLNILRKTYHNKHVDGSGNFGYIFVKDGRWYRIDVDYNSDLSVYKLDVGSYGEWKIQDQQIIKKAREKLIREVL